MKVLSFVKYVLWTLWQYVRHPQLAARNTVIVLAAFWRTVVIGRRCMPVLKRHRDDWSERTRGRYIWRVARKYWATWIIERTGIRVVQTEKVPVDWRKPRVLVANHQSTVDILLLVAIIPFGRFVAKKEVLSYPVIKWAARYGGQIVINRKDHEQSMRAIREGMKVWPGCTIIFFPEGTRTRTGQVKEFKKGAFAIAQEVPLPILPVAIAGAYEALPKGSLLRLQPNAEVRVTFGHEMSVRDVRWYGVQGLVQHFQGMIAAMVAGV